MAGIGPLRPCPFCGGRNISVGQDQECVEHYQWRVLCYVCMAIGPMRENQDEAKAAWNKREPDWEWKWSELVETVASRTDQAKGQK